VADGGLYREAQSTFAHFSNATRSSPGVGIERPSRRSASRISVSVRAGTVKSADSEGGTAGGSGAVPGGGGSETCPWALWTAVCGVGGREGSGGAVREASGSGLCWAPAKGAYTAFRRRAGAPSQETGTWRRLNMGRKLTAPGWVVMRQIWARDGPCAPPGHFPSLRP
jgi:hypothetical protein